ncbi:MAG: DUF5050 domain-containing protein [candidate division KSB1 bacterium]|nr:DUF5050 domain-containing protein [candidate division KSB1 bacterium]
MQTGGNRKLLGHGSLMTWQPNGNLILYIYNYIDIKLYGIKPDGTDVVILSENYAGHRSISPDGTKIAFSTELDSQMKIIVLNYPEFNNPKYCGPSGAIHPTFSPSGDKIAFSMKDYSKKSNDIYEISSDGSNLRQITNNSSDMGYVYPAWSPDEKKIIFLAISHNSPQIWNLYMINRNGTNLHKVIDDNSVTSCDWCE